MTLLAKVSNDEICNNVKLRYDKDIIYVRGCSLLHIALASSALPPPSCAVNRQTSIGFVLISMNPYKDLPIYTEGVLEDYIGKRCLPFASLSPLLAPPAV
jgi:myosin heavy subunit